MKERIKILLENIVYWLDRHTFLRFYAPVKVMSVDATIDYILKTGCSLVRFGDSDLTLIRGRSEFRQNRSEALQNRLKEVLGYRYDGLLVTVPEIFDGLEQYIPPTVKFWKDHLFFYSRYYRKYCNLDKVYGNTSITRSYITLKNKEAACAQFAKIRTFWKDRDVIVVEGITTHNGVGNDLLDLASSVKRILIPPTNAYAAYDRILERCLEEPKDRVFLISAGATAKPLTEDLFLHGYRVLDIGNLDLEYEWFLRGATEKIRIPKQEMRDREANLKAGFDQYVNEIASEIV